MKRGRTAVLQGIGIWGLLAPLMTWTLAPLSVMLFTS